MDRGHADENNLRILQTKKIKPKRFWEARIDLAKMGLKKFVVNRNNFRKQVEEFKSF